jgi:hypothetical protein
VYTTASVASTGNAKKEIRIYPNPGTGMFTIDASLETGNDTQLRVIDLLGNCVQNKVLGTERTVLPDLNGQPKGIYFVELSGAGGTAVKKVVLQ